MTVSGRFRRLLGREDPLESVRRSTVQLNDVGELRKVFSWDREPVLENPEEIERFHYLEDVNQRRRRDAETIATVVRNVEPTTVVDIGTSYGASAALMAANAPKATVHTVNIPPEEFDEGGQHTTIRLSREDIGSYYRERGYTNIRQILANTARWEPDVGRVDVAFIDGSHDTDFVMNDTLKVLRDMGPGAFLLWHDFNPYLAHNYAWIADVCRGVGSLLQRGAIAGRILLVRDSWVGVHRVGGLPPPSGAT